MSMLWTVSYRVLSNSFTFETGILFKCHRFWTLSLQLTQELKALCEEVNKGADGRKKGHMKEITVRDGALKTDHTAEPEPMRVEDLAALEPITEEAVLSELQERLRRGHCYTFVGDVLLLLNPNEQQNIYGPEVNSCHAHQSHSEASRREKSQWLCGRFRIFQ